MSDDNNVIEFERRAAQVKAIHAGYLVKELDGATLRAIFDAAFMDCRIDSDGYCVVSDDVTQIAIADPGKDAFMVYAFFPTSGTREQALEFCNRFNLRLVIVRAQVRDTPDSDGQWTVIFDYHRFVSGVARR